MAPTVPIQRLDHADGLPLPAYETDQAAGMDLRAALPEDEPVTLRPGDRLAVPTGFAFALPPGFEAQVRPRSGLALRSGITLQDVHQQLRGISCDRAVGFGPNKVLSVPDAIAQAIAQHEREMAGIQQELPIGATPLANPAAPATAPRIRWSSQCGYATINALP